MKWLRSISNSWYIIWVKMMQVVGKTYALDSANKLSTWMLDQRNLLWDDPLFVEIMKVCVKSNILLDLNSTNKLSTWMLDQLSTWMLDQHNWKWSILCWKNEGLCKDQCLVRSQFWQQTFNMDVRSAPPAQKWSTLCWNNEGLWKDQCPVRSRFLRQSSSVGGGLVHHYDAITQWLNNEVVAVPTEYLVLLRHFDELTTRQSFFGFLFRIASNVVHAYVLCRVATFAPQS